MTDLPARFEPIAWVGRGSFGEVWKVYDQERRGVRALKRLRDLDPEALRAFKLELRQLAHVWHPNLAAPEELGAADGAWYLVMPWIEGDHLDAAVRRGADLRAMTVSVARGLSALHAAGLVHNDLKPSNVLVRRVDDEAVVVDFGLVHGGRGPSGGPLAGTPRYAAAERLWGAPGTPASDMYAAGLLLYECVAGRLPGRWPPVGPGGQTLRPDERVPPNAPDWVASLCLDLLDPEPTARPTAAEVLARLGERPRRPVRGGEGPCLGRHAETARLRAWMRRESACDRVLWVTGTAGVGKTTLVQAVLDADELTDGTARVAKARGLPEDHLPLRVVDALVDDLVRSQQASLAEAGRSLSPSAAVGLLGALDGLAGVLPDHRGVLPPAPAALGDALRALLSRGRSGRRSLLIVDDAQWADADSVRLLAAMLSARTREDEGIDVVLISTPPDDAVETLLSPLWKAAPAAGRERLVVEPMPPGEAAEVARAAGAAEEVVAAVVEGAQGSPLLLHLLADALPDVAHPDPLVVLTRRLERHPPALRSLLAALALSTDPLPTSVAIAVAGVDDGDWFNAVAPLRADGVWWTGVRHGEPVVALYHPRWRAAALAGRTEAELCELHAHLFDTLRSSGAAPTLSLLQHARAAGRLVEARSVGAEGYDAAAKRRAWARAGMWAEQAAELAEDDARRWRWSAKRADALVRARLGTAAAPVYDALAAQGSPDDRLRWRLAAAEALLHAGAEDEGTERLAVIMAEVGLKMPRSAVWGFMRLLTWTAMRGDKAVDDHPRAPTTDERLRLQADVACVAALGLSLCRPVLSASVQIDHLDLAFRSGDPARILRAVCIHLVQTAGSAWNPEQTARVAAIAGTWASRDGGAEVQGFLARSLAAAAWMEGRFTDASRWLAQIPEGGEEGAVAHQWSSDSDLIMRAAMLEAGGQIAELRALSLEAQLDAAERDDRLLACNIGARALPLVHLAEGRAADALAAARQARSEWPGAPWSTVTFFALLAECTALVAQGEAAAAWTRLEADWGGWQRSLFLRIHHHRVLGLRARGRVAVAAAVAGVSGAAAAASSVVAALRSEPMPLAHAFASVLDAELLAARGAPDPYAYEAAAAALDGVELPLEAAVARFAAARHRRAAAVGRGLVERFGVDDADLLLRAWFPAATR